MHTVWCDVLCCPDITIGCVGGRPTCTGSSSEPPPYGNGKTRPEMNVHFRDRAPHPRQRGHLPEMARPGRKCACISGAFPGGSDPENDFARSGNAIRKWPANEPFPGISVNYRRSRPLCCPGACRPRRPTTTPSRSLPPAQASTPTMARSSAAPAGACSHAHRWRTARGEATSGPQTPTFGGCAAPRRRL